MEREFSLIYIDDQLDTSISEALDEISSELSIKNSEYTFTCTDTYKTIFENADCQYSDLILIDSALYTNKNANNKIKGEDIKVILKMYYPLKEIIVITQNEPKDIGIKVIKKFDLLSQNGTGNPKDYYIEKLKPLIKESLEEWQGYKEIVSNMEHNKVIDDEDVLSTLSNALRDNTKYNRLSGTDVDRLVAEFQKIAKLYDEELHND